MNPKPVPEHAADGEIARVYHEIRQSLRVTGVNLNFRTWASFKRFLPAMWDRIRPSVETEEFDRAADRVRTDADRALDLPLTGTAVAERYGESRVYQIRAALDLYHYINPKLLVLTSAVLLALDGEPIGRRRGKPGRATERGEPAKMFAMEMEAEKPDDKSIAAAFDDIQKNLGLPQINSDYRTLALWPDYLADAWQRLKPASRTDQFRQASEQLRQLSRRLARELPHPYRLDIDGLKALGENPEQVLKTTEQFERLLPTLILNISILHREFGPITDRVERAETPTVARSRKEPSWRAFQKRQRVHELGDQFISYVDEGSGEPVVLLHGIPTWGFLWNHTIGVLAKGHRVIAPDLLGFGYSDKRDAFDRSIAVQARRIADLLDSLEIERAHLVAHDIGGGVALRMATLLPQRVRSLCVMNTVCYDSWPIEMMLQMGHPSMRRMMSAAAVVKSLRVALKMGFHSAPEPAWFDGLLSPWRTEVGKLSLIRNAAALNTNLTTEITHLLPRISVPTLVLWGEDDKFQPVEMGERLARDIPGARLHRIPDARHFVMIDQPAVVHAQLRRFLAEASRTPSTVKKRVALRPGTAARRREGTLKKGRSA